eukprot:m.61280 g.61280  ORF g.61280 m.61280 type:complete len:198 (-) comp11854_c0_seq7:567-1160(-)
MTCVASVNERARNVSTSNTVVAGAATGFITRFAVTPLDVIKIRMQLQAEPIAHGGGKYRGTWHCFQTVVFEEGATALWRGHIAQQLLSVSYSAIQFPLFEYFRAQLAHRIASPTEVDFVAGGAAALGATLVTHPFDTVRTRMASQGRVPHYHGYVHAIRHLIKTRTLYAGMCMYITTLNLTVKLRLYSCKPVKLMTA